MKKFDAIKEKYKSQGVSLDNIEYAINSVKDGVKREFILEDLLSDYRGLSHEKSVALVEDLFVVNGGEFKKENRGGYLFGSMLLLIGFAGGFYIIYGALHGEKLIRPALISIGSLTCSSLGISLFIKAIKGQYRDSDEPFTG